MKWLDNFHIKIIIYLRPWIDQEKKKNQKVKIKNSETTENSKKTSDEYKYVNYAGIVTLGLPLYFHHSMSQFFNLKLQLKSVGNKLESRVQQFVLLLLASIKTNGKSCELHSILSQGIQLCEKFNNLWEQFTGRITYSFTSSMHITFLYFWKNIHLDHFSYKVVFIFYQEQVAFKICLNCISIGILSIAVQISVKS